MRQIKIVIADHHPSFRVTLSHVLNREGLSVVGIAEDAVQAVELVAEHLPDLLIMDVDLPLLDGIDATKIVYNKYPSTKVIILTLFTDDKTKAKALRPGACAVISKADNLNVILGAIKECRGLYDIISLKTSIEPFKCSHYGMKVRIIRRFVIQDRIEILSKIECDSISKCGIQFRSVKGLVTNFTLCVHPELRKVIH